MKFIIKNMNIYCIFFIASYLVGTTLSMEAVVQHIPKNPDNPENAIKRNIDEYRRYLERIRDKNVDVIVFPEYGLMGHIEDYQNLENYAISINTETTVIVELSNMALEYDINMIVNLLEKSKGHYYNTNLIFNKTGSIVNRYRKININPKSESKLTAGNEVVEFMLDGIQYATITNDDILFDYPTNNFSDRVTHVAIPMSWGNLSPFNMATSVQASYQVKHNKIVVAANSELGCGIYEKNNTFTGDEENSVVINGVSREKRQQRHDLSEGIDFDQWNFVPKDDSNVSDLKCNIDFFAQGDGDISVGTVFLSNAVNKIVNDRMYKVRVCSFFPCFAMSPENCSKKHTENNISYKKLTLRTNLNFTNSFPITFDNKDKPLPNINWRNNNGDIVMEVENVAEIGGFAVLEYTPIVKETDSKLKINEDVKSSKSLALPYLLILIIFLFIIFLLCLIVVARVTIYNKFKISEQKNIIDVDNYIIILNIEHLNLLGLSSDVQSDINKVERNKPKTIDVDKSNIISVVHREDPIDEKIKENNDNTNVTSLNYFKDVENLSNLKDSGDSEIPMEARDEIKNDETIFLNRSHTTKKFIPTEPVHPHRHNELKKYSKNPIEVHERKVIKKVSNENCESADKWILIENIDTKLKTSNPVVLASNLRVDSVISSRENREEHKNDSNEAIEITSKDVMNKRRRKTF